MSLFLKNNYKQMLLDIFSELSIPVEIWAYGSRVKGGAHDGSDLDLVIIAPDRQKVPIDALMDLKEKIKESNIPILVDLFDWARLPESFKSNIEAYHEVLYSNILSTVHEPESKYNKNDVNEELGKNIQ